MSNRVAFTEEINNPTMNAVRKFGENQKQTFSTAPRGQNGSQLQSPSPVTETYIPPARDPTSSTTAIIVVIIIVVIVILSIWLIYTCCSCHEDREEVDIYPYAIYGGDEDLLGERCETCGKPLAECECENLEGGALAKRRRARKVAKKLHKAKKAVKKSKAKKLAKAKKIVKAHKAAKAAKKGKSKTAKKSMKVKSKSRKLEDGETYDGDYYADLI